MYEDENKFIRLNNDYYLDDDDIGSLISVIIEYDHYNMLSRYDDCLLVGLEKPNGIRPKSMTILFGNTIKSISLTARKNIKIKFLN